MSRPPSAPRAGPCAAPRSGCAQPSASALTALLPGFVLEQFGQFLGHGTAKLLRIDDRNRAAIVAGDIMADTDRDQFHG